MGASPPMALSFSRCLVVGAGLRPAAGLLAGISVGFDAFRGRFGLNSVEQKLDGGAEAPTPRRRLEYYVTLGQPPESFSAENVAKCFGEIGMPEMEAGSGEILRDHAGAVNHVLREFAKGQLESNRRNGK